MRRHTGCSCPLLSPALLLCLFAPAPAPRPTDAYLGVEISFAGSELSSLICESGVRPAFSFTSGWKERRPPTSLLSCCASRVNM